MTDTIKGSLWMVGGVFCLTSMAVAGKEISLQIDTFEILFYQKCNRGIYYFVFSNKEGLTS